MVDAGPVYWHRTLPNKKNMHRKYFKKISKILKKYPNDTEAEVLFGMLLKIEVFSPDKLLKDGMNLLHGLVSQGRKYDTHPGVLLFFVVAI